MDIFFEREKMEYLLTGKEMTECDRYTWEAIGIPALVLPAFTIVRARLSK